MVVKRHNTMSSNASQVTGAKVAESSVLLLISITGIVGNVSLWAIVLLRPGLRTCSNGLVLCLSAADLLVCVVNVPLTIVAVLYGEWVFGSLVCKAIGFLTMLTFVASVMSLGSISINRYILICHPRTFKGVYKPAKTFYMITGTWALSALLAVPPLIGWGIYDFLPGQSICFCQWTTSISYTFFMVGVCFGGPCSVMTFCYVAILREVRQSSRRVGKVDSKPSNLPNMEIVEERKRRKRQDDLRLTSSFVVVIFVFIVSWLPFCVTMFISVFSPNPLPRAADFASLVLGCANSCYNPLIYGLMNTKFRRGFKYLYCELICRRKNVVTAGFALNTVTLS